MKKRMINSQISNYKTYLMYKRQMKTLAENVFKFNNLPEYIDVAYLNKTLLNDGAIAFFKDEVLGVIALPFSSYGKLDVYGRPNQIYVWGQNGYHEVLDKDKYVIMYDNNGKYPLVLDIAQMAERVALAVRTQDVNIIHQRTPRIWKTSKDTEKSVKDLINEIDTMVETVVTYDSKNVLTDLQSVQAPAPYVTDKLDDHLKELFAEFYRLIGVANVQIQKKERYITDEMQASQGGTIASRWSRFEPRQRAVKEINEKFGLDISVEYYDGEPNSKEGVNKDVSIDVQSNGTESAQIVE